MSIKLPCNKYDISREQQTLRYFLAHVVSVQMCFSDRLSPGNCFDLLSANISLWPTWKLIHSSLVGSMIRHSRNVGLVWSWQVWKWREASFFKESLAIYWQIIQDVGREFRQRFWESWWYPINSHCSTRTNREEDHSPNYSRPPALHPLPRPDSWRSKKGKCLSFNEE